VIKKPQAASTGGRSGFPSLEEQLRNANVKAGSALDTLIRADQQLNLRQEEATAMRPTNSRRASASNYGVHGPVGARFLVLVDRAPQTGLKTSETLPTLNQSSKSAYPRPSPPQRCPSRSPSMYTSPSPHSPNHSSKSKTPS
jgi:hypothetical protein